MSGRVEQREQCDAFAERVERLAFELWAEVEFDGAEPELELALENLRRAAADLRHAGERLIDVGSGEGAA